MYTSSKLIPLTFAILLLSFSTQVVFGQEQSSTEIPKLIKQLGSEDFGERQNAEAVLKKSGVPAIEPLKAALKSDDAEVRSRAKRILDEIGWAIKPEVKDLAQVLPAGTLFTVYTNDLKGGVEKIRKESILGKIYDSEDFNAFKEPVTKAIKVSKEFKPKDQDMIVNWFDQYGGPFGMAFMDHDFSAKEYYERDKLAMFYGINGDDVGKSYQTYVEKFPIRNWGDTPIQVEKYKGLSITAAKYDALARFKRLIIRGKNATSVKYVIDRVNQNDGSSDSLKDAGHYKEALKKISPKSLAHLYFNPAGLQKKFRPREQKYGAALGMDIWDSAIVGLHVDAKGHIREEAFCKVTSWEKGLPKALKISKSEIKLAELAPKDAIAFINLPIDGKNLHEAIMEMIEIIEPREDKQIKEAIGQLEGQLENKFNITELIHSIQGDTAFWVTRADPMNPAVPPNLNMVLSTKDEKTPKLACEMIAKFNAMLVAKAEQPFLKTADYKEHKCYWVPKKLIDNSFPYDFAWAPHKNKLLFASSTKALQELITRVSSETPKPGLDSADDFKNLLAEIPAEDRGGIIYINVKEGLNWGYGLGLAMITKEAPAAIQKELANMPKDANAITKDLPGFLFSVVAKEDGVYAKTIGSIPTTGLMSGAPFLLFARMVRF